MRNCSPACVFATGVAMAWHWRCTGFFIAVPGACYALYGTLAFVRLSRVVSVAHKGSLNGSNVTIDKRCAKRRKGEKIDPDKAADFIAGAIIDYSRVQGQYWADVGAATRSLAHLLRYMPIRGQ